MRMKKWKVALGLALLVLALVLLPYIRVEILTYSHGHEFSNGYEQTHMVDGIAYLKVFSYSRDTAKVVYITETHDAVIEVAFSRSPDWTMTSWACLWSKSGSADSFFWPYYR